MLSRALVVLGNVAQCAGQVGQKNKALVKLGIKSCDQVGQKKQSFDKVGQKKQSFGQVGQKKAKLWSSWEKKQNCGQVGQKKQRFGQVGWQLAEFWLFWAEVSRALFELGKNKQSIGQAG